jgi:hypothetical protein
MTKTLRSIAQRIVREAKATDPAKSRAHYDAQLDIAALNMAAPELYAALKWFVDDIDGTHTVMLDFDANVARARKALAAARRD